MIPFGLGLVGAPVAGGYGSNVLTGGTASASEEPSGYEASKAIDGNVETWATNSGVATYTWQYDQGAGNDKTYRRVSITAPNDGGWENNAPSDFTIDVSANGSSWDTLRAVVDEAFTSGETKDFDFDNAIGARRYLRINISSAETYGNRPAIAEIQAFEAA
jgi:hypothetical protein